MIFRFDHPALLWLLLLALPVAWLGVRSLASLDPVRRWAAIGLRLAVLTVLVLMLAGLQTVRWHDDLAVVAVIDQSESVRRFARPPTPPPGNTPGEEETIDQWVRRWVRESSRDHRPDDRLGVVTFDGRATVRSMPSPGVDPDGGAIDRPRDGSDIGGALRLAMATLPPDSTRRLFLATDGNENTSGPGANSGSDLLAAALEAKAAGIPVDVLPIDYHVEHEVLVQGVYAPTEAREGQTIALRIVLRATEPTDGTLYLKRDGTPIDLNGPAPGNGAAISAKQWSADSEADASLGRYVCVRLVELPMVSSGANRFEAVFEPSSPASDTMAANNQAQAFTLVHGKGRVLFVDGVGGASGEVLPNALRDHGILLDVVGDHELPANLADLQRYDAVIFQNVPADRTTTFQQRMLARYVNDMGGGLVMIGGPDSFGAGGWTNSPVDRILPVECQIPSQTILPSGALVIVIDRSGSMAEGLSGSTHSKEEIANEAAVQAIATLYPQDMVGVVVFDTDAQWVVPLRLNSDPADTAATVRKITPGGGTDIYPSLVMAYNALAPLQAQDAAIKHVILLTDGDSVEGKYYEIVQKMVQAGITLSTVGVGDDVNVQLLNQLAQMGGGTFYPVHDPNRLPQIFIKEARSIRKNLIKEVTFKPQLISTGSPIMAGVASVPELKGLVLTGVKDDPRVLMPIVGPEGEPVFAHWQVGLGRTAAFTSDATNRWATQWLAWGGYADFWSRTVRAVARPSDSRQFDMLSSIHGDTLHLRLDAVGAGSELTSKNKSTAQGSFSNFLTVAGSVIKPDGSLETVSLHQTGPGIYETDTPAQGEGNYIVSLFVQEPNGDRHAVFGGASRPPGSELRQFSSNRAILERVAQITGGRVLDPLHSEPNLIFNRESVVPSRSIRPLWWPLLAWLLVLFLLDVACRRIAWDLGAIWRTATGWITAAGQPRGEHAEATLAALKAHAAKVDRRLDATGELAPASVVVDAPVLASNRKFEAGADAPVDEDFAAAVGGARVSDDSARLAAAIKRPANQEQGPTTTRLLDVKRRAREQMSDDKT